MLFPIILLIVSAVILFPMTIWLSLIDGDSIKTLAQSMAAISIGETFNNTDASIALFYAVIITIPITYLYYVLRNYLILNCK